MKRIVIIADTYKAGEYTAKTSSINDGQKYIIVTPGNVETALRGIDLDRVIWSTIVSWPGDKFAELERQLAFLEAMKSA